VFPDSKSMTILGRLRCTMNTLARTTNEKSSSKVGMASYESAALTVELRWRRDGVGVVW
jgi:hypothetical protein